MSYIDSYEDDDDFDRPSWSSAVYRLSIGFVTFPVLFSVIMLFWGGRMAVEKTLTRFASPEGVFWCLLTGVVLVVRHRCDRLSTALVFSVWLLYTVGGNSMLAGIAVRSLEEPYLATTPESFDEKFDYVVVLGGGTSYGINGNPQLNSSGDRVMLAARMYLSGKADQVICTGNNIAGLSHPDTPDPGELTLRIFRDLGIPEEDIQVISGRNTSEEMNSLRDLLGKSSPRVALVTSAWHMPRAMRLAREKDLALWAVPADMRTSPQVFNPLGLVPSTQNLTTIGQVAKEYFAKAVGR